MSAGMLAAIQKKKQGAALEGDHQDMTHGSGHADDKTKDLHSFVQSLSDQDKSSLKTILDSHVADKSQAIAKGGSSTEEDGKVKAAMTKENSETDLEQQQEDSSGSQIHDSDDIAKSMLDSRHMGGNPPTGKPRNLGERMKMGIAANLKGKGKI